MGQNKNDDNFEFIKIQYQVLSNKQISHNTLVWNALSTLFVAQAFLWDISLDCKISVVLRCLVSLISILISFASFQHFIRNRWIEIADCEQLQAIEQLMAQEQNRPVMIVHQQLSERTIIPPRGKIGDKLEEFLEDHYLDYKYSSIAKRKTFEVWKFVFIVVIVFATILFLYNLGLVIVCISSLF